MPLRLHPCSPGRGLLKLLVRDGIEPHERDFERVWVALAKLRGDEIGRLAAAVKEAKMDMDYVLLWTERDWQ